MIFIVAKKGPHLQIHSMSEIIVTLTKQRSQNMASIDTVEGIGPTYKDKLKAADIATVEKLREAGAQPSGRKQIADQTGIDEKMILEWVNRVDLMRIKGVGEEYSDLLECAGVDTVVELATRNSDNLAAKMEELNEEKKLVRVVPSAEKVADWVAQAKDLPRGVHY